MSDNGWETVWPKPSPAGTEVELWGGPFDGQRLVVRDPDEPHVLEVPAYQEGGEPGVAVGKFRIEYRRRIVDPDEPEPMPLRFDYQGVTTV